MIELLINTYKNKTLLSVDVSSQKQDCFFLEKKQLQLFSLAEFYADWEELCLIFPTPANVKTSLTIIHCS